MTEEEKDRLRQAKLDVTDWLSRVPITAYRLNEVDPRLERYVKSVIKNPQAHNLYEQLAVKRFFAHGR